MFYTEEEEKDKNSDNPQGSQNTSLRICHPKDAASISRRQLLKGGSSLMAYLTGAQLLNHSPLAIGQTTTVQRRLVWIMMGGGWDILEITDPKVSSTSGIDMMYNWGLAQRIAGAADTDRIGRWLPNIAAQGADLVVVRGLSMGTTSHTAGAVYMDSGVLSNSGEVNVASIPAIVASQSAATIPMIQLQGGMNVLTDRATTNVSVVRAQNLDLYRSMYPETDSELAQKLRVLDYLRDSVDARQAVTGVNDRLSAVSEAETKIRGQFESDVRSKLELTSEDIAPFLTDAPARMNNGLRDSFAMALKLLKFDLATAINMGVGGFDTHSNQEQRMQGNVESFDFLLSTFMNELRTIGALDNTLIVCVSDFGRTPKVNSTNGRDHWPVGGALMLGGGIAGSRVVGATDDDLRALAVNTTTGLIDSSGEILSSKYLGGSVLDLCLGSSFFNANRAGYLYSIPALTALKSS